jgi:hypothetical protein
MLPSIMGTPRPSGMASITRRAKATSSGSGKKTLDAVLTEHLVAVGIGRLERAHGRRLNRDTAIVVSPHPSALPGG